MSDALTDAPDLTYSGRDTNHALGFRRWNASSHASYYTSNLIAQAIADAVLAHVTRPNRGYTINGRATASEAKHLVVLDPTCGSGRLLLPFKDAGSKVIGIELDEDAAAIAKKNLTSRNVRVGDLLLYRKILKGLDWQEGANVVLTNPPFGIWWNVPESERWETVNAQGSVESQAFTLEMCAHALKQGGLLIAIVPSSTFENGKDAGLRSVLYKNFDLRTRITIQHAFKEEYGIDVAVDLIVATRVTYRKYAEVSTNPAIHSLDATAPLFQTDLQDLISRHLPSDGIPTITPLELPQPRLFVSLPIDTNVTITPKGWQADLASAAMLDFLNETVDEYSPVQGMRVGIIDAYLSTPALIKRGWSSSVGALRRLGFEPDITKATSDRLDVLRKRYERLAIPLYRPKPHQLLGYFDSKPYAATNDVRASLALEDDAIKTTDGRITLDPRGRKVVLWKAAASYDVRPTWIRKKEVAKEETTYNEAKDRDETVRTEIERGFLCLEVQTEHGVLAVPETDEHLVTLFLSAFPLPEIEDVDDLLTSEVERNRALLARQSPHLLDYQLEDVARLLTKPRGYLGWEVGGGKTCSSIAWAQARQYKRVLVVCESGLVEKWLAECAKFGVKAHRPASPHTRASPRCASASVAARSPRGFTSPRTSSSRSTAARPSIRGTA